MVKKHKTEIVMFFIYMEIYGEVLLVALNITLINYLDEFTRLTVQKRILSICF